ncbi:hypothetical protein [Roseobacter sp. HKCCA0434]|uniref:hypothetical protein n=1 Tax=Roseobacter sp. HKCCA0434 TaxID=3079297 RepID=UPI002905CDF4|nr:hypothetical protein [Roseobacter sp. HKCCA0434]
MRQHGVEPDVVTWSTLAARAPTWSEARAILDEMRQHGVEPNAFTAGTLASKVETPDQATEIRDRMRELQLAGTEFHRAILSALRRSLSAQALLDWAFSGGKGFPFDAIETPIAGYRRDGQLEDALRLVLGWPHFEASRRVLQDHPIEAEKFLRIRYEAGSEAHLASRALGILYIEHDEVAKARDWLQIAKNHPDSTPARRRHVEAELAKLSAGFSRSP